MAIRGESNQLGPWTAGVNYAIPAEDMGPDEIFDCENVRVGIGGEVSKRRGTANYNSTQISAAPTVVFCGQHRFSASSEAGYVIAGTKIFEDDLAGALTDRSAAMTITAADDNTYVAANFNGDFYATNGVTGDDILRIAAAGNNAAAADVDTRFATAKSVEPFDNRLWWANLSSGVDRVWRSDLADGTTYGANSFFQLGDDVTGMRKIGNSLAMHTEDSIFLALPTGNAAIPYKLVQRANAGTISERGIATVHIPGAGEVQIYIRRDGIYVFNGDTAQKISAKLDGDRYWDDLNKDRLFKSFVVKYPLRNELWFWLPNGPGQTTMNQAMIYDYNRQIWYGPYTGVTRNCGNVINDEPHFGGHSNGYVFKHNESTIYDDDGSTTSAVGAYFETAAPAPMGTDIMLRWLFLRTSYDVLGAYDILTTYTSPGIAGDASTITVGGGFDPIETDFEIEVSAIAADASLASVDSDLSGYDPNIKIRYANASSEEDFKIRRAMCIYKPLGRVRKTGAGVV